MTRLFAKAATLLDDLPLVGRHRIRLAAVGLMMTLPSLAASAERPEDFIRRVYALYRNNGPGVSRSRPSGAAFYAASLLDAFEKDEASGGGTIDWDPICNCQVFENLRVKTVVIAKSQAGTITAHAALVNLKSLRTVILTLSRTPAGWRISDVGDKADENSVESIMALLREANAKPVPPVDPKAPPKP